MSNIWKLPTKIADDLKAFMTENNMTTNRFIIDLEKETIEDIMKDYSTEAILSLEGIFNSGDADELRDHTMESGGMNKDNESAAKR